MKGNVDKFLNPSDENKTSEHNLLNNQNRFWKHDYYILDTTVNVKGKELETQLN